MGTKQTLVQSTLHYSKSRIPPDSRPFFLGVIDKTRTDQRSYAACAAFQSSTYICVNASVFIQMHFLCILCNALRVVTVRPLKNFTYGNYFHAKQNFWPRESER